MSGYCDECGNTQCICGEDVGPPIMVECMPGVIIRPGDVLVLSTGPITMEQLAVLRERVMARLPGLADVVVLGGAHVEGVYRDEELTS